MAVVEKLEPATGLLLGESLAGLEGMPPASSWAFLQHKRRGPRREEAAPSGLIIPRGTTTSQATRFLLRWKPPRIGRHDVDRQLATRGRDRAGGRWQNWV